MVIGRYLGCVEYKEELQVCWESRTLRSRSGWRI